MKSLTLRILSCAAIATSSALATPVSLPNSTFESPSLGRIANGFDSATDIPGWKNSGGTYGNSGVELALQPGAAGGYVNVTGYVAFLRGTDGGAYQVTSQTISSGQVYRLSWKAGSISGLTGTTNQQVRLFRTTDNGVTRTPLVTSTTILNATQKVFETYVLAYTAVAGDAGAQIGIEFDNTSTGSGIIGFDDFVLDLNPSGPTPATGLPSLTWDNGSTDDGTLYTTVSTGIESEFHYRIQTQSSLNGGWRSVLRVASGNANIYASQSSWPTTTSYSYKSDRLTGDDGFILRPDQFSAGQTWYITVRATAGTTFTLFSGDLFVQDLGALGFTDAPPLNGQYDIGETAIPSGSGAVAVKGEGMRFFKATVPAGTPAWSLWLNGDTRDLAVRRITVPFHSSTSYYDRKQSGQMLVVPTYLGTGTDTYFISVIGNPGDAINLDSRIQEVEVLSDFETTKPNVQVSGPPYRVYRTDVPVDQIAWDVSATRNSGNPNVCVRKNNVPAEWDNDAYSEAPGTATDSVTLVPDFLTNGTWFITVYGTGAYNFTLKSGNPTVTPMAFTDIKTNDQTTRAGWRFYSLTDIPSQVGSLGWELLLSGQVPGSQISIRRNKVPSRWQYRTNGSTYVNDTQVQYADFSSTGGFLQRPGHQADVWYIGVFTPQLPLGGFVLDAHPIEPATVGFDGSYTAISGLESGRWKLHRINVPAGVLGWDVRVKNVTGTGDPQLVVRRDQLPQLVSTRTLGNSSWQPDYYTTWASGNSWAGELDWTNRPYEVGLSDYRPYRSLVMAMGRPLEPGTYYVGVYNGDSANAANYTLVSCGIGAAQTVPVATLGYAAGSNSTITNLAAREAAYFKVVIPANTPSWEFTLTPTTGEMMICARRTAIPDFLSDAESSDIQDLNYNYGVRVQKAGAERYVLLPKDSQNSLLAGDYYIAVISEGVNPSDTNHIGSGSSSGTLASNGPLVTTDLGTASLAGLTQPASLEGGQYKSYSFTVPAGTASLEVRLDNRVGNPNLGLVNGSRIATRYPTQGSNGYGYSGGQYSGTVAAYHPNIITVANPPVGVYSVIVRADPVGNTYSNAAANLVVRQKPRIPLNFASSLNAGGGTHTNTQQLLDGQKFFYEVAVPTSVDGQPVIGWILRNSFQQGNGAIRVYKTWGNPSTGITVSSRTAVIAPPFLTPGDTWYVEVQGIGLTNYTITSEPVTLHLPAWDMPTGHNQTFGDTGAALSGDKGNDLGQDDWHFYAIDVPEGNSGLLRTELQAINGNPNLYIREDGVPTTDHDSNGGTSGGTTLTPRSLTATASEYGNWVPLDGRTEKQLRAGRWYLGVKATGGTNTRYRLIVSNGVVRDLPLNSSAGVLSVNVTNGGSGYTDPPIVVFSGGGGTGATANVTLQNGIVVAVNVTNPGSGYTSPPTVVLSGGSGSGATATATFSQSLVGRDWRYYRFTVPVDAPVNWNLTFGQQVGDVVMWLRDGLPPGNGYDGLESTSSQGNSGLRSWYSDNKNQGPYTYNGYDAQGTYTFNTPPLRPGGTYYVGFKANNDATFTFSSSTSGSSIGSPPVLDFYTGVIDTSILPDTKIPPNSSRLYQISVPPEATRLKWTSTHASTVQMRLEQGTLPGTSGTAQHYYSSGTNSAPNYALSASSWPWQPNQTYYLRIVNNAASEATVTLNMKGKNAATEDEDTDDLPDAWELTYFSSIYSYNGTSDPDLDGVTNAVEFVDGTNPNNINSALYFVTVNASGGSVLRSPSLSKYSRGSSVSLTPTPDSGLAFIGWTGGLTGTSSPANLTVNSNLTITATFGLPIETAVDTSALTWSTGGSGLWFGQNTTTHDGVDAAQSGIIGNSQESWMETSVTGPGTLTFWWKVSSQAGGDFLQFLLDGAIQSGRIDGTVNWAQKSIPISAGNHTLRWRYLKDGSTVSGSDTGWVDEVVWSPTSAYTTWASTKFSAPQLTDPLISGPSADPDKDGLVNLLECAFNTLPLTPGNQILMSGTGTTGPPLITKIGSGATTRLRIEYIRRKTGLTYSPEVSDDLSNAGWTAPTGTPVVTSIDAEWERVVVEDTAGTSLSKRFGRVRVTVEAP